MSEEKKSILGKLFKRSGGCSCGVEIVEESKSEKKSDDNSKKEKSK